MLLYYIIFYYVIFYYVTLYDIKLNYSIYILSIILHSIHNHHQIRRDETPTLPGYAAEYVEALNELEILSDLWRFGQRNSRWVFFTATEMRVVFFRWERGTAGAGEMTWKKLKHHGKLFEKYGYDQIS